jgi:orotate phosphoribosyltransferase
METLIPQTLLEIQAVGFALEKPIRFKSGLLSPVYVDNRRFPYYPEAWSRVIEGFTQLVQEKNIEFDVVAGIETAGIPHSAALGYTLQKPSVFIRKEAKDHGTKKMVEGGEVLGKKVLLIEDHVTTGMSSLHGVRELKNAGAEVVACLSITSYEWPEAQQAFAQEGVPQFALTFFAQILEEAERQQIITAEQSAIIHEWQQNPQQWSDAHEDQSPEGQR